MIEFKNTSIPRYALNTHGRDFAVGDIHGAFGALQRALEAIGFDARKDRLFSGRPCGSGPRVESGARVAGKTLVSCN